MKTVLILSNHHLYTYNLRKELIEEFINQKYRVVVALPYGEKVELLKKMGCEFQDVPLNRRGTNPLADLKLLIHYIRVIMTIKPDLILTYTLKPNLYGGIASKFFNAKVIHTVTGLGSVFVREVWYKKLIVLINKLSFKKASFIFFMNEDNRKLYSDLEIIKDISKTDIVAGSGVDLKKFEFKEYPKREKIKFTFIARILKDKGIEEFLAAAQKMKEKYKNTEFEVVGFVDEEKYKRILYDYEENEIIAYLGQRDNISEIMAESNCIVLPSYGEGRGTVLQEAASVGRPIITCDIYGCKDNVEEGINGYMCKVADVNSLIESMEKFVKLDDDEREIMGKRSREKAEKEFDRNIVVKKYLEKISSI